MAEIVGAFLRTDLWDERANSSSECAVVAARTGAIGRGDNSRSSDNRYSWPAPKASGAYIRDRSHLKEISPVRRDRKTAKIAHARKVGSAQLLFGFAQALLLF